MTPEDHQLFSRLKTMIDATVKLECSGCRKLIPTCQFYEHLIETQEHEEEIRNCFIQDQEAYHTQSFN